MIEGKIQLRCCFPFSANNWYGFKPPKSPLLVLYNTDVKPLRTYFIFGSFCAAMFFFTWFFIPETKGISLERMDDLFGVTRLVEEKMERDDVPPHNDSTHKDISVTNGEKVETV